MTEYLNRTYDINDPKLVSTYDELSLWAAPFGLKLLDTVEMRPNITILDVGPGPGFPLVELANRFGPTSKLFGIDPWEGGIQRIKEKIVFHQLKNIEIVNGIAEKLPFENEFFDLVVSNNGMNNVENQELAFNECFRVSKSQAQFVFTMNQYRTMEEFYDIYCDSLRELSLDQFIRNIEEHRVKHRPSNDKVVKIVNDSGFIVKSLEEDIFKIRFATGTALLNHSFIKIAFLLPWKNCIPSKEVQKVFPILESNLNSYAKKMKGIELSVPFACYNCLKP
jgi:ubiquinone/menaquinone biosynthesis C-methylase UbiE